MLDRVSTRSIAACVAILLLTILILLPSAYAQDPSISTSTSNVRAARLTFMQGAVTVNLGGNTGIPAQMNLPLLAGVQLATGVDGQAEVEFEDGSVARLTPNSVLSLDALAVDPSGVFTTNLSLLRGLGYFELRATPQYVYTIDAGGDVLSPVENTTVRVDFDEAPASFAVLNGTAQVERGADANTGGYQTDARAGESLRADPANPSRYFLTEQIAGDTWDQWNVDMDQNAAAESAGSTAVRNDYAGAQGYGWSDLDANGTWYDVPGQEPVWQPQAAMDDADFDPYGNGAWVWYPGTGYLWASGYAWGWTPYRCGTWGFYNGFGWGWAPGAACGGFGWGFLGGGFPVNIGLIPRGYRPIHVPVGRPGRPVLPVRPTHPLRPASTAAPVQRGPRTIGGVTARPIAPVTSYVGGEGAAGGSLRRDFPIDRATHTPALGLASTRPATAYTVGSGARPANAAPGNRAVPENGAAPTNRTVPANRGVPTNRAAPADGDLPETIYGNGNGSGQASGSGERPAAQGSQQQAPQQQGPQRSRGLTQPGSPGQGGGQTQTVRPAPTAPQQQREPEQRQAAPPPHYSPPPPAPRPSYTPPPPHFSPPPPPPPHVSSPPPAPAHK